MNIFVTGATGYIGQKLAQQLAEAGHRVHALCRSASRHQLPAHPNILAFEGDLTDVNSLYAAAAGCEQAYHLAAYARVWAKDTRLYELLNVEGTRHVLDAAVQAGIRKLVFTSTAGVLGPSGNKPVTETDTRRGDVLNEYEDTKTRAEALCRQYAQAQMLEVVIVNPPRVYGPGLATESNAVTRLVKLYLQGKWKILPGDGSKIGSYVFIEDVVHGHLLAMQKGRSGERYILSGVNASYREFFHVLAKLTGKKQRLFPLPVTLMLAAGRFMQLRTALTGHPPLLTPKWIRKYLYNWSLSCEKAETELGYTYLSLEKGLQKTIDWINQYPV